MHNMPPDRKSIVSIVIPRWRDFEDMDNLTVAFKTLDRIGVLSVDSSTPLPQTGWGQPVNPDFTKRLSN